MVKGSIKKKKKSYVLVTGPRSKGAQAAITKKEKDEIL